MNTTNLSETEAAAGAVSLTLAACRGRKAPETAKALRLDPLVYAALLEELGLSHLPRTIRDAFDVAVISLLEAHNRGRLEEVQVEELPGLGWIQITEVGEENVYFDHGDGRRGFVKVVR